MDTLSAIKYLVEHEPTSLNEWVEAGMYNAIQQVLAQPTKVWLIPELNKLINDAKGY